MEPAGLPYWLYILICLPWLVVGCVVAAWSVACRSTRRTKQQPSPPPTQISEGQLAKLDADQAELFSTLAKLTTTVKRLSSRAGMEDVRARKGPRSEPPRGTSKADLLRFYGMSGKVGPEFARAQQALELEQSNNTEH